MDSEGWKEYRQEMKAKRLSRAEERISMLKQHFKDIATITEIASYQFRIKSSEETVDYYPQSNKIFIHSISKWHTLRGENWLQKIELLF